MLLKCCFVLKSVRYGHFKHIKYIIFGLFCVSTCMCVCSIIAAAATEALTNEATFISFRLTLLLVSFLDAIISPFPYFQRLSPPLLMGLW